MKFKMVGIYSGDIYILTEKEVIEQIRDEADMEVVRENLAKFEKCKANDGCKSFDIGFATIEKLSGDDG